jgi:hypothetical protein
MIVIDNIALMRICLFARGRKWRMCLRLVFVRFLFLFFFFSGRGLGFDFFFFWEGGGSPSSP